MFEVQVGGGVAENLKATWSEWIQDSVCYLEVELNRFALELRGHNGRVQPTDELILNVLLTIAHLEFSSKRRNISLNLFRQIFRKCN